MYKEHGNQPQSFSMLFGTYRFILAYLVALSHLLLDKIAWFGHYSVAGFYILSGYLMTYILNETYGLEFYGIRSYLSNRLTRIYPTYWLALIIAFLVISKYPSTAKEMRETLVIPNSLGEFFSNLFIIGLAGFPGYSHLAKVRMIPPAWSLHIELIFYLLIPFLGRNIKRASFWLILSMVYTLYSLHSGKEFSDRYQTICGASLFFAAGSLTYYLLYKTEMGNKIVFDRGIIYFLTVIFILNLIFVKTYSDPHRLGYYVNSLINLLLIVSLSKIKRSAIPNIIKKVDKFLGSLSYPMYLIHWQVYVFMAGCFWKGIMPQKNVTIIATLSAIIIIISATIYLFFDKRVEPIRDKIRGLK